MNIIYYRTSCIEQVDPINVSVVGKRTAKTNYAVHTNKSKAKPVYPVMALFQIFLIHFLVFVTRVYLIMVCIVIISLFELISHSLEFNIQRFSQLKSHYLKKIHF